MTIAPHQVHPAPDRPVSPAVSGGDLVTRALLVVGAVGGFALLFVSILLDRLRDLETDRYRRVRK